MSDTNGGVNGTYAPANQLAVGQLHALVQTEAMKRVIPDTINSPTHKAGDSFKIVDPHDPTISYTITPADFDARLTQAVAVILSQSDGWTNAECRDHLPNWGPPGTKPRTDKSCNAAGRGTDRGIWQFNSHAWGPSNPKYNVTDQIAFDPTESTKIAYLLTDGFKTWTPGPWSKDPSLDHTSAAYKRAAAYDASAAGTVHDDTPGPSSLPKVSLPSWTQGLTKFFSYITSAAFWRRFGTGGLGIFLVVVALVLLFATSSTGKSVMKGAALA